MQMSRLADVKQQKFRKKNLIVRLPQNPITKWLSAEAVEAKRSRRRLE